jgi:hypothetical protein
MPWKQSHSENEAAVGGLHHVTAIAAKHDMIVSLENAEA